MAHGRFGQQCLGVGDWLIAEGGEEGVVGHGRFARVILLGILPRQFQVVALLGHIARLPPMQSGIGIVGGEVVGVDGF